MKNGILLILIIAIIIFFLTTGEATAKEVKVFLDRIKSYEKFIDKAGQDNILDPDLIRAIIWQESSGNINIIVNEGKPDWYEGKVLYSYGLMGLTFPAAQDMGYTGKEKDLVKPEINIKYASLYLRHQIDRYEGDVSKGLVSYNAGYFTGNYTYAHNIWVKMAKIKEARK